LHVLGTPPAFVLSQDQTLRQNLGPPKRTSTWRASFRGSTPWLTGTSLTGCSLKLRVNNQSCTEERRALAARTGFFVLYSVFKERHVEEVKSPELDTSLRAYACRSKRYRWLADSLPLLPCCPPCERGSVERTANLPSSPRRVKLAFGLDPGLPAEELI
jgi:hypothetical protein